MNSKYLFTETYGEIIAEQMTLPLDANSASAHSGPESFRRNLLIYHWWHFRLVQLLCCCTVLNCKKHFQTDSKMTFSHYKYLFKTQNVKKNYIGYFKWNPSWAIYLIHNAWAMISVTHLISVLIETLISLSSPEPEVFWLCNKPQSTLTQRDYPNVHVKYNENVIGLTLNYFYVIVLHETVK